MSLYDCDLEAMLAAEEAAMGASGSDDFLNISAHSSGDGSGDESDDTKGPATASQPTDDAPFYEEMALCPVDLLHTTAKFLLSRFDAVCARRSISGTGRLRRRFVKEVDQSADAMSQDLEGSVGGRRQYYSKCNGLLFLELLLACLENEEGVLAVCQSQPAGKTNVEIDVISQNGHRWIKVKGADPRNVASEFNGTSDRNAFSNTAEAMVVGAGQRILPFSQNPQTVVLMYRVPTDATPAGAELKSVIMTALIDEIGLDVVESYIGGDVYAAILEIEAQKGLARSSPRFMMEEKEVKKRLEVMSATWGGRQGLHIRRHGVEKEHHVPRSLLPSFTVKEPLLINFDVTALVALCSDTCHGFAATTTLPQYPVLNRQLIDEVHNPALTKYIYPALDRYTVPGAPRWWRAKGGRWWAQDCKIRRTDSGEGMGTMRVSSSPIESNVQPRRFDFHKGVITCSDVFLAMPHTDDDDEAPLSYPVTHAQIHDLVSKSVTQGVCANGGSSPLPNEDLWSSVERDREVAQDATGIYIPSVEEQEGVEERDAVWCSATNPMNISPAHRQGATAGRYNWIVSDVAFAEFDWIVRTIASPAERQRARFLLSFIHVVPTRALVHVSLDHNPQIAARGEPPMTTSIFPQDYKHTNPCWSQSASSSTTPPPFEQASRLCRLSITGRIKPHHMAVFGLGDAVQAVTLTANEQFLAAAREQQHTLAVLVHPSRALTGKKSLEASGAAAVKYKPHGSDQTRLAVMEGVLANPISAPSTD